MMHLLRRSVQYTLITETEKNHTQGVQTHNLMLCCCGASAALLLNRPKKINILDPSATGVKGQAILF